MDDLGAIVIIALFYTSDLSTLSLLLAGLTITVLFVMNRFHVRPVSVYIAVGAVLWFCVLKSGVHATLAGVIIAFAIPLRDKKDPSISPVRKLEHALHPWVAYVVFPLFAFANAGVPFEGITLQTFTSSVPLGIALGLFFGKQIGIFIACWLSINLGIGRLPQGASWSGLYGIALVCGVCFTMSLFIGTLAFPSSGVEYERLVWVGVLMGSLFSGLIGYLVLQFFGSRSD